MNSTVLRAEHKARYAALRIDDKAVSSLLEHYKVGVGKASTFSEFVSYSHSNAATIVYQCLSMIAAARKIGASAEDVLRKCEVILRLQSKAS